MMLTFIVPCYQYGHYLEECIQSILKQTYQGALEVLILDDASTDNTPEVAKRLVAQDNRVRYLRNATNLGHLSTYNRGIHEASGDWIWLISADDCLASPNVVEALMTQVHSNPKMVMAFCRVQCIDEHSVPYDKFIPRQHYDRLPDKATTFSGEDFFRLLLKENFVPAPAAVAKKSCYEKNGMFHMALTHSGDWYNWLLFALEGEVYYHPEPMVYYRKHQQNMHMTYQKPMHALENSVLCYIALEEHLRQQTARSKTRYPASLQKAVRLAKLQYKKQNKLPLTLTEKITRTFWKLSGEKLAGHYT